MEYLTPVFCMMAYTAVITHLLLLFYQISGAHEVQEMKNGFSESQKKIYKEIQQERRIHYIYGTLVGLALAILYMVYVKDIKHPICTFVGISTIVGQNFYLFMPKSKWMVEYLEHPQDIFNWNKVYKKFQYLSAYGNFLGFIFFASTKV